VAELAEALRGELPWWASAVAAVVLALAGAVARRVARRSAKPQGERLGEVERLVYSEQTRRRQAERELYERYGIELPYWPPDGPHQARPVSGFRPVLQNEDQDDELPPPAPETSIEYVRPAVPPFPEDERQRLARHRR
jgi:hypothetical protein